MKANRLAVYFIALLNVLLHIWVHDNLEYHRDELLYFALGGHPDFGYATVPPLIGWIAGIMQWVFGYSVFAVKLFPALLGGVMVIVGAEIVKELGGKGYAQVLVAVAILFLPVGLRAFHLFQPVPLDFLFWTLAFLLILRFVNTDSDKYLYLLGLTAGFALLNKYLILLLFFCLGVALLLSPHRMIFKRRATYIAIGIALLIFLPNIIWQLNKGLPVIGHMRALNENQLVYVEKTGFMIEQLLMTFSSAAILVIGWIWILRKRKFRFVGVSSLLVMVILLLLSGKSYYTMGIFPVLLAGGCVVVEQVIQRSWLRVLLPVLIILLTLGPLPIGLPIYDEEGLVNYFRKLEENYGLEIGRRFEDGTIHSLPQDYADQLGWEELTSITKTAYDQVADKESTIIYCENYGQAGAIAVIGKKYGLPEPVCFHESFFYWVPESFDPDIESLIYINDELGADIQDFFQEIKVVGRISNENAREYGTTVYLCTKPVASFNQVWAEVVSSVEDPF